MRGFRYGGQLLAASGGETSVDVVQRGLSTLEAESGGASVRLVPPERGVWAVQHGRAPGVVDCAHQCVGHWASTDALETPFAAGFNRGGAVSVALAGRLVNGAALRERLRVGGAWMSSNSDAELLAQLVSRSDLSTPVNRLVDALWRVDGGFSVVLMDTKRLVAVCDPWGLCSMFLGRSGATVVLASSAHALVASGATMERQLVPGEMAIVENGSCVVVRPFARGAAPRTIQDEVGMARGSELELAASRLAARREMGAALAQHSPLPKNSVVVGMPGESSYAEGYARSCGSSAETAFMLEPGSGWIAREERVLGRTIVLVVDAVANGDRVKVAAHGLRVAGAKRVVLRVARPMRSGACGWEAEALGSQVERLDAARLGVDDLAYLPESAIPEGVSWSGRGACGFCHDCCASSERMAPESDREQLPLFEG